MNASSDRTDATALGSYRMLDLSRLLPGPFASHILADMGMEVVKVEEPEPRYGMSRDVLSPIDGTPEDEERHAAYNALARGKKSVALNLLNPDFRPRSQELFYELAKGADVVLEGYRPGVLKWMGIDYETVRAHNPGIIYCSISGYGQDGPYMQYPGHDPQFSAVAGFAAQVADGGTARGHGIPLADLTGSMYAAISILAAVVERERTGEGQYIDVSMLGAVMSLATTDFSTYFREGRLPAARRGSLTYVRCQDGKYVSLGNAETIFWENFCRALGHEEWIALRGSQGEEYEQMVGEVEQIFLTRPRDEWLALLRDAETCIAPVHDIPGAFADPQVRHIGMALELEHPSEGEVMQLGFPVRFSRTPGAFSSFAPVLGQHTREVLRAAGLAEAELDELEQSGITKSAVATGSDSGTPRVPQA